MTTDYHLRPLTSASLILVRWPTRRYLFALNWLARSLKVIQPKVIQPRPGRFPGDTLVSSYQWERTAVRHININRSKGSAFTSKSHRVLRIDKVLDVILLAYELL